jgi:GNAT superfamily N-acetyltransferase
MTGRFRRAVAGDVEALSNCISAAYARYADLSLPDVSGGIGHDISDHLVWVYEIEDAIVGGIVVSRDASNGHLRNLAVHPAQGGRGIGTLLINAAIEALAADGVTSVSLATHKGMPENVRFYAHLGWVETGRSGDKVYMSRMI